MYSIDEQSVDRDASMMVSKVVIQVLCNNYQLFCLMYRVQKYLSNGRTEWLEHLYVSVCGIITVYVP